MKDTLVNMLFPVNRETRKLIAVIRDLLFLIAVNCAQDPPLRPLLSNMRTLIKSLIKH